MRRMADRRVRHPVGFVGRGPFAVGLEHQDVERFAAGLEAVALAGQDPPRPSGVEHHRRARLVMREAAPADHHADPLARVAMPGLRGAGGDMQMVDAGIALPRRHHQQRGRAAVDRAVAPDLLDIAAHRRQRHAGVDDEHGVAPDLRHREAARGEGGPHSGRAGRGRARRRAPQRRLEQADLVPRGDPDDVFRAQGREFVHGFLPPARRTARIM